MSHEGQKQDTLYREMEGELLIMETTFREAGLCVGNMISLLEQRVHDLREEESKSLVEMQEGENEEHRLTVSDVL